MDDTSPAARRRYRELLGRQSPAERLSRAVSLSRAVRDLAIAGIRAAHPLASEREVSVRLAARLYGVETAGRLFGGEVDGG